MCAAVYRGYHQPSSTCRAAEAIHRQSFHRS